ncbi:CLUMA_CG007971, isoform A [Clunio marinus]|uniref:CLUMA_CG007971, isoform A n=1 Tax=Clunio marinus TaxID=568069 RepID=A0A1J1I2D4_9DIPT|nr:CLUMA_CG007971, isoform A [Clunio marinus]
MPTNQSPSPYRYFAFLTNKTSQISDLTKSKEIIQLENKMVEMKILITFRLIRVVEPLMRFQGAGVKMKGRIIKASKD